MTEINLEDGFATHKPVSRIINRPTLYLCAGHTPKGVIQDSGAVGNGYREADLTMELRDLIADEIRAQGGNVWEDEDTDSLALVLNKINALEMDIVCDIHFNAANKTATGTEVIVPERASADELRVAALLSKGISDAIHIRNRGVKHESETHRGKIGILRENGLNILIEVCFIDNATDIRLYQNNKQKVVALVSKVLMAEINRLTMASNPVV